MPKISDFWGPSERKRKRKKIDLSFFSPFFNKFRRFFSVAFVVFLQFSKRLWRLPKVLNKRDKIILLILLLTFFALAGYKFNRDFLSKTKKIPVNGGTFTEVLVGEAKYFNPVIAKSDTDKIVNHLIYSGLTKIDENGNISPDLAKNWEISADGKTYTFHLRTDIFWHDGIGFTSHDVSGTIETIKTQNIKSPYYESWKDVTVETPDDQTVIFRLSDPYGPFIYNTLIGIIPSHLDSNSISSSPVGTGPYKFSKAISGKNSKVSEIDLKRNPSYYAGNYYIDEVVFQIAEDEIQGKKTFESRSVNAISGVGIDEKSVERFSFNTSRYFGLIFNLKSDKFKDEAVRKKILAKEKIDPSFKFSLLVLDKPLPVATAESLKKTYADLGVEINIDKKNAVEYSSLAEKRNYEAILFGFDSGYDRDPYVYWHSSQIANGYNFAGFSDKASDILLESARMTVDNATRNQKYDQFFATVNAKALAIFLPNQSYDVSIKDNVFGISAIKGLNPQDQFDSFANWYLKTKRVKP